MSGMTIAWSLADRLLGSWAWLASGADANADANAGDRASQRQKRNADALPAARSSATDAVPTIDGIPLANILTAIRAGDRDAFAKLYEHSFRSLWTVAMMHLHSPMMAEEIVQDVFLWLWTHPDIIVPDRDIRTYLATAVRKRASNVRKHHRVRDALECAVEHAVGPSANIVPAMGQPIPTPDVAAERGDLYAAYTIVLATLSERERVAAKLRWEDGMTFEEIGHALSLGTTGARKVVLRAQQKVQAALDRFRSAKNRG